jgi:hypothetical protein
MFSLLLAGNAIVVTVEVAGVTGLAGTHTGVTGGASLPAVFKENLYLGRFAVSLAVVSLVAIVGEDVFANGFLVGGFGLDFALGHYWSCEHSQGGCDND